MNKIVVDEVEVIDLNNQKTELVFERPTVVLNVTGDVKVTTLKGLLDNLFYKCAIFHSINAACYLGHFLHY